MSEFTLSHDPMSTLYFVALQAGTRLVHEIASVHGWDAVQSAGPGEDLDRILSTVQQEHLYGAIRDILAGRVPSPFASSAGPVTT